MQNKLLWDAGEMSRKTAVKPEKGVAARKPRPKRPPLSLNAPVVHVKCELEAVRKKLGLTQPVMAKECGISPSCLWKYEQGVGVKLHTARRIAKRMVGSSSGDALDKLWPES